jgi:hypothetical protein
MGWRSTKAVWDSALPGSVKPMAAVIAGLVLDVEKGERPALTLFAQLATLAERRGVHLTAARKQVQALVRVGVLEVVTPGGGRRRFGAGTKKRVAGVATCYRFHPEKLPAYPSENARESECGLPPENARESSPYPSENTRESSAYPSENARALGRNRELGGNRKELRELLQRPADAYAASRDSLETLDIFDDAGTNEKEQKL